MPEATAKFDATPAAYTVADIARLMQCSVRHAWRLAHRGVVPGRIHTLGRLVRFSRVAVDDWLSKAQEME